VTLVVIPLALTAALLWLTSSWRQSNSELAAKAFNLAIRADNSIYDTHDGTAYDLGEIAPYEQIAVLAADHEVVDLTPGIAAETVQEIVDAEIDINELGELDVSSFRIARGIDEADTDNPDENWRFDPSGDFYDPDESFGFAVTRCADPDACSGVVAIRRPSTWWEHVRRHGLLPLLGVAVTGLLSYLLPCWLVRRTLRPVDQMRRELDAITADDLSQRVPVPPVGNELNPLATSLNRAVERVEAATDSQRQFISDAAHELRSPLTGLRSTLENAQRDPSTSATHLTTAIGQVDRTSQLIDDLLTLAQRDSSTEPPKRVLTDLDEVIRREVRELRLRQPSFAIDQSEVTPAQAHVDAGAIGRLVRNLLDNAAAHGASKAHLRLSADVSKIELTISDDGPGIPVADRDRLFDRFVRLDASRARSTGGSGLGLAIVAGIAADHAATVRIDDSPLGGSAFVVTFAIS
jgi:signal transduction histidine kinase